MSTNDDFTRIISIVAELTREERAGREVTLDDVAARHDVSEDVVKADIRALTLLGDSVEADWLLSLRVLQQDRRVSIASAGPFRRPVRLSPEEHLAIQIALHLDPGGSELARRLSTPDSGHTAPYPVAAPVMSDERTDQMMNAVRETREISLNYTAADEEEPRTWTLQPHQVVDVNDRTYVVAWVPDVSAWRHFRMDRVRNARVTDGVFVRRDDFIPVETAADIYRPETKTDEVLVRFAPAIAEWVLERYPAARREKNGSATLAFRTNSPEWMARRVLEYGPDAEIIGPARYRDAVRRAVV